MKNSGGERRASSEVREGCHVKIRFIAFGLFLKRLRLDVVKSFVDGVPPELCSMSFLDSAMY